MRVPTAPTTAISPPFAPFNNGFFVNGAPHLWATPVVCDSWDSEYFLTPEGRAAQLQV